MLDVLGFDEFSFLIKDEDGVLHGHHCPNAQRDRRNDWAWWRQSYSTCLHCAMGRWRPQTWHLKAKRLQRVPAGAGHVLCLPPPESTNVIILRPDGCWDNWDGHTPGIGFIANHKEGHPIAVYTCGMRARWNCRACDYVGRACSELHSCANGHPVKPLEAT